MQVALQAIYSNPDGKEDQEEAFRIDEDEQGLSIKVVPHPGDAEANFVWAELGIRYASSWTATTLSLQCRTRDRSFSCSFL